MRLPVALLSVFVVPVSVIAAPVATPPGPPAPRPVAPEVVEVPLEAAVGALAADGPRALVRTEPRTTEPFSTVGVTWARGAGELQVSVRTRGEQGWRPWSRLENAESPAATGAPDAALPGLRDAAGPFWAGRSDGVQVRVDVVAGAAPRNLTLVLVDPGSSSADAAVAGQPASVAAAAVARPVIRSRAEWGADESLRRQAPGYSGTVEAVSLHHTAGSNDYTQQEVPAVLRGIYAFHVTSRGWSDIGYNVLVDRFGTAWEGRAGGLERPVVGAHTSGFNTATSGIAMMGNYESAPPPAAVQETVAQVAAWKLSLAGRDPGSTTTLTSGGGSTNLYAAGQQVTVPRVFAHRDVGRTADPGTAGYARVAPMRDRAAAIFAGSRDVEPAPTPPPPAPSAQPAKPFGALDRLVGAPGTVRTSGWVIDPDAVRHTSVEISVDGAVAATAVADRARPDVNAIYPQYSPDHGFDAAVEVAPGPRRVCVKALDQNGADHLALGCKDVTVTAADPVGSLDRVRPTADVLGVRLSGWALDPDAPGPSAISVRVDGVEVRRLTADLPRPDVVLAYPGYAERRGYDAIVPATPGSRRVCAVAVDEGAGADKELGCVSVEVPVRPAVPATPPGSRAVNDSCPTGTVPPGGFTDIATSVHRASVDCAVWWQLTTGLTPDRYGPQGRLTRGQVASFLARLLTSAGATLPAAPPNAFDDDRGSPHELAINQMAALGVVAGRGGRTYEPNGTVTRGQMASYLVRTYEKHVGAPLDDGGNWYTDDNGSVHEASIGRAARAGLTGGTGPGTYAPLALTDRGQVASFLTRLLDLMVENGRAPRKS